jgi:mRNA interferase MazF
MARLRASPGRADIVWVDLNHERGTEIRKIRPAVVISNDSCNRYGTRVVVQPIAGNINSLYPAEALVQMNSRTARVLGDQIRSVDKSRLGSKIGALSPEELLNVEEAVRVTLDTRS